MKAVLKVAFCIMLCYACIIGVVVARDVRETASDLMNDPDTLFEMYKQHKVEGASSPLQTLLNEIFTTAEETHLTNKEDSPKHVLTILTDDMGYADIGYHDSTFITPCIDTVANRGMKLSSFYVHGTCSPTRASLLTGRYLGQTGLQVSQSRGHISEPVRIENTSPILFLLVHTVPIH